jgi:uncharacterized membrane protein
VWQRSLPHAALSRRVFRKTLAAMFSRTRRVLGMSATMLATIALSLAMVFACFFVHFEALRLLTRAMKHATTHDRLRLVLVMSGLVAAHIAEVALFGAAFFAADSVFHLGSFVETRSMSSMDYFYYAAETYSSLGYGDIYPLGDIRLLASITPLVGLLLLGWSGAFLFSLVKLDPE